MQKEGKVDEVVYHYILRELMREVRERGSSTHVREYVWTSTVDGVSTEHTATVGLGSKGGDWLWVEHKVEQKAGTHAFQPVKRTKV